jgi:rod shape-determining protein MreD
MFVVLLLVQVLILNHIHLFQIATPLLYVYYVVTFRMDTPKWVILTSSFGLGLLVDIFSNTAGMAAGCMTLIAMIQPYLMQLLAPRDAGENMEASAASLGSVKYAFLCTIQVLIYCVLFFAIESFSFFDWQMWGLRALGSALLTLVMVLAIESVRSK